MISIFDLIKQEDEKIKKANKLRIKIAKEDLEDKVNEANLWATLDFKAKGATTDKMREKCVIREKQILYPSFVLDHKAQLKNLEKEISHIRLVIDVMREFKIEEIEDEKIIEIIGDKSESE